MTLAAQRRSAYDGYALSGLADLCGSCPSDNQGAK